MTQEPPIDPASRGPEPSPSSVHPEDLRSDLGLDPKRTEERQRERIRSVAHEMAEMRVAKRGSSAQHPSRSTGKSTDESFHRYRNSITAHVVVCCLLIASLVSGYLTLHWSFRGSYTTDAEELIDSSLKQYSIRTDPRTGLLALDLEGRPLAAGAFVAGPLGVGNLPSVRGLLNSTVTEIDTTTAELETRMRRLVGAFKGGVLDIGDVFPPDREYDGRRARDLQLRPSREGLLRLPDLLEQPTVVGLHRLFLDARIYDRTEDADDNSLDLSAITLPDAVSREALVASIERFSVPMPYRQVAYPKELRDDLTTETLYPLPTIPAHVRAAIAAECGGDADSVGKIRPDCDPAIVAAERVRLRNANLTDGLRGLALAELSGFWFFGHWRWFEVIFWTWAGVLTQTLVNYGAFMVGAHPRGDEWEPMESLRNLSKLFYAPLLSIVVIWTLVQTSILDTATIDGNHLALTVALAFVLGLFPNIAYRIARDVARAVFQETSITKRDGGGGKQKRKGPGDEDGPAPSGSPKSPRSPRRGSPSIATLKRNVTGLIAELRT